MNRRYPAEWEPHWGTLIAWPYVGSDWDPWLDAVRDEYAQLAANILRFERLIILCRDRESVDSIPRSLKTRNHHSLSVEMIEFDDTWVRDFGPQGVYEANRLAYVDFVYNAWGGKYACQQDDRASRGLWEKGIIPRQDFNRFDALTLEGGALESDGTGTLMVRSSTVHDNQRNPGLSRETIEQRLRSALSVRRILWLEEGHLDGDDTDGHIDTLARFVDPKTIVYQPSGADNDKLRFELETKRTADGDRYRLIALPVADDIGASGTSDSPLPASYANFLHVNGAVIVPGYGQAQDTTAREILQRCCPDCEVITSSARTLIEQFGSLHCATLHIPAMTSAN